MNKRQATKAGVFIIAILVVIILAYSLLIRPDHRNAAERIGDAIHDLPQGADKAGRQLGDRTTGQRIGDAFRSATQ